MEIAATGLVLPLPGPARDRPPPRPGADDRAAAQNPRDSGRANVDTGPARGNERVVRGEVIYDRPESRGVDGARPGDEGAATRFNQPNTRRFSLQAAIQTFRDNEALLTAPGTSRQVSGIIDEYV